MKILNLNNGVGRYDDVSPFIVADDGLELKIVLPFLNGEFFFIAEYNGHKSKIRIPNDGKVSLTEIKGGELNAVVKHYLHGEFIREYPVEPLELIEVDGRLTATPEFAWLKSRIKDLEVLLATTRTTLIATVKVAWEDYSASPYMDGKGWVAFVEKYGFAGLTEQEIEIIKGGNLND